MNNWLQPPTQGGHLAMTMSQPHDRLIVSSIVQYLRKDRGPKTLQNIHDNVKVNEFRPNLQLQRKVHQSLSQNANVLYDPKVGSFSFKPTVANVTNRLEILRHIKHHPDGTDEADLLDAYEGIEIDISALKEANKIIFISSDLKKMVLYPRPPVSEYKQFDEDIRELWSQVTLPQDDISQRKMIAHLKEHGHDVTSATESSQNRLGTSAKKKAKKKRKRGRVFLTNTHLKDKFSVYQEIGK